MPQLPTSRSGRSVDARSFPLDRLNQLLAELGEPPPAEQDYTGPHWPPRPGVPDAVMTPSSRATLHHGLEHALTKSLGRLDLLAVPGERPDRGVHALLEREDLPITRPRRRHHLAGPVARQPGGAPRLQVHERQAG